MSKILNQDIRDLIIRDIQETEQEYGEYEEIINIHYETLYRIISRRLGLEEDE